MKLDNYWNAKTFRIDIGLSQQSIADIIYYFAPKNRRINLSKRAIITKVKAYIVSHGISDLEEVRDYRIQDLKVNDKRNPEITEHAKQNYDKIVNAVAKHFSL